MSLCISSLSLEYFLGDQSKHSNMKHEWYRRQLVYYQMKSSLHMRFVMTRRSKILIYFKYHSKIQSVITICENVRSIQSPQSERCLWQNGFPSKFHAESICHSLNAKSVRWKLFAFLRCELPPLFWLCLTDLTRNGTPAPLNGNLDRLFMEAPSSR